MRHLRRTPIRGVTPDIPVNARFQELLYQYWHGVRGVIVEDAITVPADPVSERAFESFYMSELEPQVRRAIMLLGSDQVANDVVHDAFIEIYRRWTQILDPGPYLHVAVLNRCRDVHRKRSRFRRALPALIDRPTTTAPIDDSIEDVLATLPFNHRAAIVLKFYFGLSTKAIATELNCAPGSVGPWIDRGLDKIRKALQ